MYVYNLITQLQETGTEAIALIPNYGIGKTEEYFAGSVRVIKYGEPSVADRELIMGRRDPDGLVNFKNILSQERPDIVHFHEIAGSNGITYRHPAVSKEAGYKNVMTFHLSGYSCKTGNLMYKDETICDGIIRTGRCAACYYKVKMNSRVHDMITFPLSMMLYSLGINSTDWNSKIGTGLGFAFLIKKLKLDLLQLADNCDALVSLTDWYKDILVKNGIGNEKIFHVSQGLTAQKEIPGNSSVDAHEKLKIIFIGRISPFKGLHLLIAAFRHVDEQKISLDIYGQDPGDNYSVGLKTASSGMRNIRWKGTIVPGETVATISGYDLLCLPSTFSEMSPLVIQEAFAARVPVLASDVYGNAEQVTDNENGWLFRFKDVKDLEEKLQRLADDPMLVQRVKKNIGPVKSFSAVAEEQLLIYKKILNA